MNRLATLLSALAALGVACSGAVGETTVCRLSAQASLSAAIPTVGIVTWTSNQAEITRAEIEFGLADDPGTVMVAPVDLAQPDHRTLLLGMKGERTYSYRVVAHAPAETCTSPTYPLTTGAVPSTVPRLEVTIMDPAAHDRGFIITASDATPFTDALIYILDADGEPVWWAPAPIPPSRAHMSWDGQHMWVALLNLGNTGGEMRRISMDGLTTDRNVSGLSNAHHDFTPIPGNGIAATLWNAPGVEAHNTLVERSENGELRTVVDDLASLYDTTPFHPNAIHYYPSDDSYTISDRGPNLFVKVARNGELLWQLGGANPKDPAKFFTVDQTWQVNHGHQLLPNGHFLFFNNGVGGVASVVRELALDTTNWTATSVWTYRFQQINSKIYGDAERLPNGNTLATFSTWGQIHEVDPAGHRVMVVSSNQVTFTYADFRESLYGQPPR